MTVHSGSLSSKDSAAIDGLRGLAALTVVASHSSLLGMHWVPGLSLAGIGKSGVYLFFVVSAFLLTLQWLQRPLWTAGSGAALRRYTVRRVLRIYPLYTVVLLVGYALPAPGLGVPLDAAAVWQHMSLRAGEGIYWSVPVEFKFYLVIPLYAALCTAPALVAVHVAWRGLALTVLLGLALWMFPAAQATDNSIELGFYLPAFLSGSAAAWLLHSDVLGRAPGLRRYPYLPDMVALGMLCASVPALLQTLGGSGRLDLLHREFLAWGVFWSVLLLAVVLGWTPAWRRALQWPGLRACGRWCFGLYLLHMPALYLVKKLPLPEFSRAGLGLLLALGLAALAHLLIERPAMALAARITRPGSA